ncbi:MAG TPA: enoyl-CoA hydratase-related protein [Chitinophagaceae bacterium]|jgi:enoyl-CoA hydratase|nr:enoyl-CoA hydratase-related protein [Chitinophagaceae bacterium]
MYQTLLTEVKNGILTVTINRPDKLNALNRAVFADLETVITEAEQDEAVRAVILTGAGNKAFVAGADITEFSGLDTAAGMELARSGQQTFFRIERNRKPWVAAVNGFALGGGCELAMACHFRIASDNAQFGQPEVNLGLIPGYGGTQRLTQLIGKGRALELLMSGERIPAATALQYGLVNYVTPPEELLPRAEALLTTIISKAPLALAYCIASVNAAFDPQQNGYDVEIASFGACFETEDMKEGTAAFREKRKPVFTGR